LLTFATPGAEHNRQNYHHQKAHENDDQVHFLGSHVSIRKKEKTKQAGKESGLTFMFGEKALTARRSIVHRSGDQTVHPQRRHHHSMVQTNIGKRATKNEESDQGGDKEAA